MGNRLEFGAAFSRVFELYGKYAAPLLIWSAAVQLAVSLVVALLLTVILTGAGGAAVALSLVLVGAVAVIGSAILTGAYIVGLDEAERTGSFPSFGDTWGRVSPRIGALIITSILAGLGIAFGLLLLLVPGLILMTWWAVFGPVVMLEGKSNGAALGRSRELVKGNGWTVFGLVVVVMILTQIGASIIGAIVGSILGGSDEFLGSFGGQFVSGTLLAPVTALLAIVLYQALLGNDAGTDGTALPPNTTETTYPGSSTTPPPANPEQPGPFV